MKKGLIVAVAAVLLVAVLAAWKMNAGSGDESGAYDNFAKCLTEKGVKMYGAYWCPHCQNEEKLFGSSWKYVTYVECSLPDMGGETQACSKAGIAGYPTWEFGNGERVSGEMPLQQLSEKSGCVLQ